MPKNAPYREANGTAMDIVDRLEIWRKKDSIVARDWGEDGWSIDGDIEKAIEVIKDLRIRLAREDKDG